MNGLLKRLTGLLFALIMSLTLYAASADDYSGLSPVRTYNGNEYRARPASDLTTILLIGYDHYSSGVQEELHGYSSGGQADFLLIVVLDHENQQIRRLQLNRDTMTGVRITDENGRKYDPMILQLCLAHAYGDTREENNANTIWSVERLMGIGDPYDGAQIDWYMAMDMSGIEVLNDCLGGVTVTVPVDMSAFDPEMTEGAVLRLTGKQAYYFCRYRYDVGDQTNASRMERHEIYMEAAGNLLKEKVKAKKSFAEQLLDDMGVIYERFVPEDDPLSHLSSYVSTAVGDANGKYLMTNTTKGRIVKDLYKAIDYELLPLETLSGTNSLGSNGFVRYDLDEDAALKWTLSVFYDRLAGD